MKTHIAFGLGLLAAAAAVGAPKQLTIELSDYLTMPMTGKVDGKEQSNSNLARVNYLVEEPDVNRDRFFINDQNGALYIVNRKTKQFTTYLDFNGRDGAKGIFHRFSFNLGYATGLISFVFDPDYQHNGRFYTLHIEEPTVRASAEPDNSSFPGLNKTGYKITDPIKMPGNITREAVIIEWTDTNPANSTFEGTAREVMRIQQIWSVHPVDDMVFNPTARPGDPEWRVMYISCGDNGTGEDRNMTLRFAPQRLDTFYGKILRIIPDPNEHRDSSKPGENGRYRVPGDNPFVETTGARPEIWAYGLRNPHRLNWDVDPADPQRNHLLANVIGLNTWETVFIIHKGTNYGYPEREGNQQLSAPDNHMGPIPSDDRLPMRIGDRTTSEMIKPVYPVLEYDHSPAGGDGIAGGFVYRGRIAALQGKFIFGDITTGHIWWADLKEMIAADDGDPRTMAPIHEVRLQWKGPDGRDETYPSLAPIASITYHKRGGVADPLPGRSMVAGTRTDLRFALDRAGELYILSKSDGMVRLVSGASEK